MKIAILIFIFFAIGALLIISNNNLAMVNDSSVEKFSEIYVGWMDRVFSNSLSITGRIIEMNWFP